MQALRQQLLAGTAFPGDQHGGVGLRVALRQAHGGPEGRRRADDLLEAVARSELARPCLAADAPVGALDGVALLAGDDHAVRLAVLDDRRQVGGQGLGADPDQLVFLTLAAAQDGGGIEVGDDLADRSATGPLRGSLQQGGHPRVDGLHPSLGVEGDHPVAQVAQHGVEALLLEQALRPAAADG
ncbi:hypothetical protein D3C85_1212320 [compost metagenome]